MGFFKDDKRNVFINTMKKRKIKISWTCSNYVHHVHETKFGAWLCGKKQRLLGKNNMIYATQIPQEDDHIKNWEKEAKQKMSKGLRKNWFEATLDDIPDLLEHINYKPGKYYYYGNADKNKRFAEFPPGVPFIVDATNNSYEHKFVTRKRDFDFDTVIVSIFYDFYEDMPFIEVKEND